jgi:hypothetical protein
MATKGDLVSAATFAFFHPVQTTVAADGVAPVYGPAGLKPMLDGLLCLTAGTLLAQDQSYVPGGVGSYAAQLVTFGSILAGTVLPISPSIIDSTSTGTFAALYH